jgi:AcrR family transcriptional regulator
MADEIYQSATNLPPGDGAITERQMAILAVAAEAFAHKGFVATSLQEIADAVGIQKGSLYHHLKSKEDLLYKLINQVHRELLANITEPSEVAGSALVRLRGFIEGHINRLEPQLALGKVAFTEFRHLTGPRRESIVQQRRLYLNHLVSLIDQGQQERQICPDVDCDISATVILHVLNSTFLWYNPRSQPPLNLVGASYADLLLRGLACTPDEHTPGHARLLGAVPDVSHIESTAANSLHRAPEPISFETVLKRNQSAKVAVRYR